LGKPFGQALHLLPLTKIDGVGLCNCALIGGERLTYLLKFRRPPVHQEESISALRQFLGKCPAQTSGRSCDDC
jgi:hypothetical protein